MMETVEEFQAARRGLEQRSPKALVDFILSLAQAFHGIGECAEVEVIRERLLARDDYGLRGRALNRSS